MSCCGKQRQQLYGITPQRHQANDPPGKRPLQAERKRYTVAYFEYLGRTGMSVVGPRTGKLYRFDYPGAVVAVDLRDRLSLTNVPHLRQVTP